MLAGNFFIADTTLLVEGESDAMYVGALLSALDRAESVDVDLNLFSVQRGNARDFEPMARMMLEEGRHVVALMDGDRAGNNLRREVEKLNLAVRDKRVPARSEVAIVQLKKNESIEDILPVRDELVKSVVTTGQDLVAGGHRQLPPEVALSVTDWTRAVEADKGSLTLGRHFDTVTKGWFAERQSISKLAIARAYCAWLERADLKALGQATPNEGILELIKALGLESKMSEKALFEAGPAEAQGQPRPRAPEAG